VKPLKIGHSDGYVLGEAFKTIKLERDDRAALRATLHTLVDATPTRPARRGRAHRGARPWRRRVPDISGVWKWTIQASAAGGKDKWQGPAELTLNQNGNALSGTLVFTHPQAGRVQVPITSGIVSKDAVTFSGQNQFPMGSLETLRSQARL
jgi:hypothetical protein